MLNKGGGHAHQHDGIVTSSLFSCQHRRLINICSQVPSPSCLRTRLHARWESSGTFNTLKCIKNVWQFGSRTPRYNARTSIKDEKQTYKAIPIPIQIIYSGNQAWYIINFCLPQKENATTSWLSKQLSAFISHWAPGPLKWIHRSSVLSCSSLV